MRHSRWKPRAASRWRVFSQVRTGAAALAPPVQRGVTASQGGRVEGSGGGVSFVMRPFSRLWEARADSGVLPCDTPQPFRLFVCLFVFNGLFGFKVASPRWMQM